MTNAMKIRIAHVVSIIVAIAFPVVAVFQKLSVKAGEVSKIQVLSFGAILVLLILCVTLKKMLFKWIKEWLGTVTMPPIIMWLVFLTLVIVLQGTAETLTKYLPAVRTVCIAGILGAGIGCIIDAGSNLLWKATPTELNE